MGFACFFLKVVDSVRSSQRALVLGHAGADGDVAGGCLALKFLLESLGQEVVVYNQEPLEEKLRFLPGAEDWITTLPEGRFDTTIIIDAAHYERCGLDKLPRESLGTIIWIDHHKDTNPPVDVKCIDLNAPAAGEMVLHLADALGVSLPQPAAQCVMAALMTDTGGFRYRSASLRAFESAARLMGLGAQPHEIATGFYESRSTFKTALLAETLANVNYFRGGRLAVATLYAADFGFQSLTQKQTHGLVNELRGIEGVDLAMLLVENERSTHIILRDKYEGQSRRLANALGFGDMGRRFSAEWHDPRRADALFDLLEARIR